MKKYVYLELSEHMNHKMLFDDYVDMDMSSDSEGVMGLYAVDKKMSFANKTKYFTDGGARILGTKAKTDNIRCLGQVIDLPDVDYKKMLLVGFHETGSYYDSIKLVDDKGKIVEKKIMLYQMLENLDLLYECDLDEKSRIAYSVETNAMIKMHYYVASVDIDNKYRKLILQDNEEAHIAAISLMK